MRGTCKRVSLFNVGRSEKSVYFFTQNERSIKNYEKDIQAIMYGLLSLCDYRYRLAEYEYKYRRGGKTLCALYARENCVGFMIILGKDERLKFDTDRNSYSKEVQKIYDETKTYHDGKWLMFEPTDTILFNDFVKLLGIKRKPNRK